MKKETAEDIMGAVNSLNSVKVTLLEAFAATEVMTDGLKMYALQKGDSTILVWIKSENVTRAKIVEW